MADFASVSDDFRQACLDLKVQIHNKLNGTAVDWIAVARALGTIINFSSEIFSTPATMRGEGVAISLEDCANHLGVVGTKPDPHHGMQAIDLNSLPWKQVLSILMQWLLTRVA